MDENKEYLLFDEEAEFLAKKYIEENVVTENFFTGCATHFNGNCCPGKCDSTLEF